VDRVALFSMTLALALPLLLRRVERRVVRAERAALAAPAPSS